MNKAKILEMSQKEHKDEGVEYAEKEGLRVGFTFFGIISVIVLVVDGFYGNGNCVSAITGIICAFMGTGAYSKYKMNKSKINLLTMVAFGLASVINVINFVNQTLKV